MKNYRRKPSVVRAVQFTDENKDRVYHWAKSIQNNVSHDWTEENEAMLLIPTDEGGAVVLIGDWIINGAIEGLYRCSPRLFEKTYSEVKEHNKKQGKASFIFLPPL